MPFRTQASPIDAKTAAPKSNALCEPIRTGAPEGWECSVYPAAAVNHIPVTIEEPGLTIVGHRVPEPLRPGHWEWLHQVMLERSHYRTMVIGDFNADPNRPKLVKKDRALLKILASGWHRPIPSGSWSFYSNKGATSQIDHALLTSDLHASCSYVYELGGIVLGGPGGLSDHVPLVMDVSLEQG